MLIRKIVSKKNCVIERGGRKRLTLSNSLIEPQHTSTRFSALSLSRRKTVPKVFKFNLCFEFVLVSSFLNSCFTSQWQALGVPGHHPPGAQYTTTETPWGPRRKQPTRCWRGQHPTPHRQHRPSRGQRHRWHQRSQRRESPSQHQRSSGSRTR